MFFNKTKLIYASHLLKMLLGVTLLLLCAHITLQYINWEVFYQQNGLAYELANRFDLDDESSVATWFSQLLFLAIGLGAALAAYLQPSMPLRRLWQTIAAAGLLFSIDEGAGLHEFVLQSLHVLFYKDASPTSSNNAWLLVAPFIFLAAGWLVWRMARLLPKRTILLFTAAIATFLVGAIGVDMLTSIVDRETFLNQGVLTAVEETLELLASVFVVYALADYLETHHRLELQSAFKQLGARRPNSK